MMKEGITPETMGIKVKSIHQTLSGALRLTVAETTSGAKDKLVEKIRGLAPDTHVRAYGNSKAVVITDIEQDATQSTVEEALARSLGMPKDDIRVTELRNSYRGTKSTTAYLPLQAALKAIELSKLKVGWTMANIKEKVEPNFCGHCQTYGHRRQLCQQKEASKRRCFKCGGEEHIAKDCSNGDACMTCDRAGKAKDHRANSMRCPEYRAQVMKLKTRNA